MSKTPFAYIWRFTIRPERRDDFLVAYRPGGDWSRLFERDPDYLDTKLLQDADDENVFITIDYWTSRKARDDFREKFAADFASLDERCEDFTTEEENLGDYTDVEPADDAD